MKKFFACYFFPIMLVSLIFSCTSLHAVIFTTNAWIADGDTTYDGQQVVVDGSTLTIDGLHYFSSVYISNSAVITHSTGSLGVQLAVSNFRNLDPEEVPMQPFFNF